MELQQASLWLESFLGTSVSTSEQSHIQPVSVNTALQSLPHIESLLLPYSSSLGHTQTVSVSVITSWQSGAQMIPVFVALIFP